MYRSSDIEIWNLTNGGVATGGAQSHFNVVGRINGADKVAYSTYSLNGAAHKPFVFMRKDNVYGRLEHLGDFNIDTIDLVRLKPENILCFKLHYRSGRSREHCISFRYRPIPASRTKFQLKLRNAQQVEQAGQVIDGLWRVEEDEDGVRCLTIRPEEAGYDRLIVFGRHEWSSYEVRARIKITSWTNVKYQNVGLLFHWNPHSRGDGSHLPWQWSTGLAYYAAQCPGLRLRYGVNVHFDNHGVKQGCYVLRQRPYSIWRRVVGLVKNEVLQLGNQPLTQLPVGVPLLLRLRLEKQRYQFTVWEDGKPEPPPQLKVSNPRRYLTSGAPGLIAAHCALQVSAFEVWPIENDSKDRPISALKPSHFKTESLFHPSTAIL